MALLAAQYHQTILGCTSCVQTGLLVRLCYDWRPVIPRSDRPRPPPPPSPPAPRKHTLNPISHPDYVCVWCVAVGMRSCPWLVKPSHRGEGFVPERSWPPLLTPPPPPPTHTDPNKRQRYVVLLAAGMCCCLQQGTQSQRCGMLA
jgi:hypothetical protein